MKRAIGVVLCAVAFGGVGCRPPENKLVGSWMSVQTFHTPFSSSALVSREAFEPNGAYACIVAMPQKKDSGFAWELTGAWKALSETQLEIAINEVKVSVPAGETAATEEADLEAELRQPRKRTIAWLGPDKLTLTEASGAQVTLTRVK